MIFKQYKALLTKDIIVSNVTSLTDVIVVSKTSFYGN